jgi:hypothetical protein
MLFHGFLWKMVSTEELSKDFLIHSVSFQVSLMFSYRGSIKPRKDALVTEATTRGKVELDYAYLAEFAQISDRPSFIPSDFKREGF